MTHSGHPICRATRIIGLPDLRGMVPNKQPGSRLLWGLRGDLNLGTFLDESQSKVLLVGRPCLRRIVSFIVGDGKGA